MARIPLTNGFTLIPEGTYVFRIDKVEYDETFGTLEVNMTTKEGYKHRERYSLKNADDEPNEGAMNAFSYLAKTALNNFNVTEIDPEELEGHYLRGVIVHSDPVPSRKDPTKTVKYANITDKYPADGFDGEAAATQKPGRPDLDSLLG